MGVLACDRELSDCEFYVKAIELRTSVTRWLLKDFNTKRNVRSVRQVIKDISPDDQKTVDDVFRAYGVNPRKGFQSEFPSWFVNFERKRICDVMADMIQYITEAYFLKPRYWFECGMMRGWQDMAIGCCFRLLQELQYVIDCFSIDINKMKDMLDLVDLEIKLLKRWRGQCSWIVRSRYWFIQHLRSTRYFAEKFPMKREKAA